jgi:thioredoxin family protein
MNVLRPASRRWGRAPSGRAQPTSTIALTTRTFGRAVSHPDILFAKVDVDAERELAAALHITSLPTLTAFRDGTVLYDRPAACRPTA